MNSHPVCSSETLIYTDDNNVPEHRRWSDFDGHAVRGLLPQPHRHGRRPADQQRLLAQGMNWTVRHEL